MIAVPNHNKLIDRQFLADILDVDLDLLVEEQPHLHTQRKSPDTIEASLFYYENGVKRRKDVLVFVVDVSDVPSAMAYDVLRDAEVKAAIEPFRREYLREF